MHRLLGIETWDDLSAHPKVGASWEGFIIEQLLTRLGRNATLLTDLDFG